MPRIIQPKKSLWLPPSPLVREVERHHPWFVPGRSWRGLGRRCCCEDNACVSCASIPAEYEVIIPALAGGTCPTTCTEAEGTFILAKGPDFAGNCGWLHEYPGNVCGEVGWDIELVIDAFGPQATVRLSRPGATVAFWGSGLLDEDCSSWVDEDLAYIEGTETVCSGVGTTVVVSAVIP